MQRHGDPLAFKSAAAGYDKYDDEGNRWCSRHRDWLPNGRFSGNKTWCRDCRRFSRYGLTPEQYTPFLKLVGSKCPICLKRGVEVIDHDHACCSGRQTCGKCVRGMLCKACNSSLGTLTDEGIRRAMKYLEVYERQRDFDEGGKAL